MPLTNTVWPDTPVPEAVKKFLETLYTTIDSKDPSVPGRVAAMYTEDAIVYGAAGKATGRAEIIQAREKSWAHMETRKHEVLRVYSNKADFSDILFIGKLTAKFKNGNEASDEFVVRLVFENDPNVKPPIGKLYQIWADSAPWIKAMKG